ncbi:MAG: ABC transporter ATP-binding protein [Bacteroidota bacterium]
MAIMSGNIILSAQSLGKKFNRRTIIDNISFSLTAPSSLALTGKNGSGKSTLCKMIAGILEPSSGSVSIRREGHISPASQSIGFVAPYLNLYDEFTAAENIRFLSRIRSRLLDEKRFQTLMEQVDLWKRRGDEVGTFSSGMKQKLKYVFALVHEPPILILDEPASNLDDDGIRFVGNVIEEQKQNSLLIIATNDADESLQCSQQIRLGEREQ